MKSILGLGLAAGKYMKVLRKIEVQGVCVCVFKTISSTSCAIILCVFWCCVTAQRVSVRSSKPGKMTPRLWCEPVWAGPRTPWHGWRVLSWFIQNQKQQKDPTLPEDQDRLPPSWHRNNKGPVFKAFNGSHSLPVSLVRKC